MKDLFLKIVEEGKIKKGGGDLALFIKRVHGFHLNFATGDDYSPFL
jgi:hypothetical protein